MSRVGGIPVVRGGKDVKAPGLSTGRSLKIRLPSALDPNKHSHHLRIREQTP